MNRFRGIINKKFGGGLGKGKIININK